jgi:DHA2 family multidrug resistance protein
MFAVGIVLLASSSLLAPWLQNLGSYPVETAGLVMAPRGAGTMVAMMISGRLASRVDPRKLMGLGVILLGYSLWQMTGWSPDVPASSLIVTTVIQGAGLGFVFIPLQVVAFGTMAASLRTDGTALLSLFRNVGSAIGVSVTSALVTRNTLRWSTPTLPPIRRPSTGCCKPPRRSAKPSARRRGMARRRWTS